MYKPRKSSRFLNKTRRCRKKTAGGLLLQKSVFAETNFVKHHIRGIKRIFSTK